MNSCLFHAKEGVSHAERGGGVGPRPSGARRDQLMPENKIQKTNCLSSLVIAHTHIHKFPVFELSKIVRFTMKKGIFPNFKYLNAWAKFSQAELCKYQVKL